MAGGVHGRGVMHGGGACMVGGVHGREGMPGREGMHLWGVHGGVHGRGIHGRGHAWQGGLAWQDRWPLQRTVRILLECILVPKCFTKLSETLMFSLI